MRTAAGLFDVSHMGEIETSGPRREAFLQRLLSNDVDEDRRARRAVLACSAARTAASSTTSSPTGSAPDALPHGHERLQPREGPRLVPRHAGRLRRRGARRARGLGDARAAGPEGARDPRAHSRTASARAHAHRRPDALPAWTALVCGTGYTGEDGVRAAAPARRRRGRLGRAVADGRKPAGLGARDTLRLEVCFHLYGNDMAEDRNPIEAGLGWCCKLDTGFIGSEALRGLEPTAEAGSVRFTGPGIPRQGNPMLGGRRRAW